MDPNMYQGLGTVLLVVGIVLVALGAGLALLGVVLWGLM